jgi:hypothetical protein
MKKVVYLISCFLLVIIVYIESRSFYNAWGDQYFTVWKTLDNRCYIIPGKYYGFFAPNDGFVLVSGAAHLDIVLLKKRHILIAQCLGEMKINPSRENKITIENYNLKKKLNDSLLTYSDGRYMRYKKKTTYISLFINENYAVDKNGLKL